MEEKEVPNSVEERDKEIDKRVNSIHPETPRKAPKVKVKLSRHHTHEGVVYPENTELEVDEDSADYIIATKSGTRV
jgi:hypothetical protein